MKTIIVATLTLLVSYSYAQTEKTKYAIAGFGTGYLVESSVPTLNIQAGYKFKGFYGSFNPVFRLSSDKSIPFIFGFNVGYGNSLQPFVSYSWHFISKENKGTLHELGEEIKPRLKFGYGLNYYMRSMPISYSVHRTGKQTILSIYLYTHL